MNKTYQHTVYQMGEIGIIFMGLREDQIIKVTVFLSGLKNGFIEFPLDYCLQPPKLREKLKISQYNGYSIRLFV